MNRTFLNQGKKMLLVAAASAAIAGCGGATAKKETKPEKPVTPYSNAESEDLNPPPAAESTVETSGAPTDLKVPGAEFGKGTPVYSLISISETEIQSAAENGTAKQKKVKKVKGKIPNCAEIESQMEGLTWGMHYKNVMDIFEKKVRAKYEPLIKEARGAVEEDHIRMQMSQEISKITNNYVVFDGKRTGFEGSLIEPEFTHNNGESLIMWDAGKYVEYLFFFNDRLWKRYRSFRKDSFQDDITFEKYLGTLENRFGPGLEVRNEDDELVEEIWQNDDTYMSAQDKSGFYGVYCLVFASKVTEENIARLRPNKNRSDGKVDSNVSSMVGSVTSGDVVDHESSVIDSFTGKSVGAKTGTVDMSHSVMGDKKKPEKK